MGHVLKTPLVAGLAPLQLREGEAGSSSPVAILRDTATGRASAGGGGTHGKIRFTRLIFVAYFTGSWDFRNQNEMMDLSQMLMLGDPRLYQVSTKIQPHELEEVHGWAQGLDGIILQFRSRYGAGRAVAAPQMGIFKRLVCMHIETPVVMINPVLSEMSEEVFELWDDCMCFPNLFVKVKRHRSCVLHFRDLDWKEQIWELRDDLSELLQHEVDHLDGILATQRAIDAKSFRWR